MIDPQSDEQTTTPASGTEADSAAEAAQSEPSTDCSPAEAADPAAEIEKWRDLAYRSQAELDNFRKRQAREKDETRAYANTELLRAILPILDNFQMGLDAARAESETSMIFMGMQMVARQFQDLMRDFGVQEIEAEGKMFDPNLHEAVATEPAPGAAEGSILRVTRRGFKYRDRLLRPASVVCAAAPADQSTEVPVEGAGQPS
jgi:molecular chaperone GrpE